jgi:hypothetical protein
MRQIKISYAKAEDCFYEVMRINKGSSSEWSVLKEGNALIVPTKTDQNYEIIPHHENLNPSSFGKHNRGRGIADYHKRETGRSARMNGSEDEKSKAVGCIITLPKTYLLIDYGFTEQEYAAVTHNVERGEKDEPESKYYRSAIEKICCHEFSEEEKIEIKKFFTAAFIAWKKVAGVRNKDILFAVVHMDESYPHLHIMALPTYEKNGKITYSVSKYNNQVTHYFDTLHTRVIQEMKDLGVDASGLLNGSTKGKGFEPGDFTREQRAEGVRIANETAILRLSKINAEHQEKIATENLLETRAHVEDERDKLLLIQGHKEFEAQRYNKLQKENDSMTTNNHSMRQRLKNAKKNGKPREVNGYDYERFYGWKMNDLDIRIERERLKAKEADIDTYVETEVQKRLPSAIRNAREDREYCDKWLIQAQILEMKDQEIIRREEAAKAIEEKFEHAVEKEVVIRLRDRVKEIFVEFISEIFRPDGFMIRNMKKCLPREMFEGLERFIRSTIDNIERKLTGSTEGQGDVIENEFREQDLIASPEDCYEDVGFEED